MATVMKTIDRDEDKKTLMLLLGSAFILAGILAVAAQRETLLEGVGLLTVYSAGLGVPFLIAGWSIEHFFRAFARVKQHFRKLEIVSGLILVAVGGLLVSGDLARLNSQFAFMSDFINRAEQALQ